MLLTTMLSTTWRDETQSMEEHSSNHDLELIRQIAKGDKSAFEALFRLYHARVYRFSIRMVHDHHVAEEVVCDTLYAVWNSASKFKEQSKVSTWILGIAYKRAIKSFQQQARHSKNRDSDAPLDELESSALDSNPEVQADSELLGRQLTAGFSTLSAKHRAVLELTALGHTIPEISKIVGCPENTVKTRTFHARRKLQSALQA